MENTDKALIVAFIQGAEWWSQSWGDGNVDFTNDKTIHEVKLAAYQKLKKGILGVNPIE